jgi:hypothetical protein
MALTPTSTNNGIVLTEVATAIIAKLLKESKTLL